MIKIKLASKIFKRSDWYVTSPFGYRQSIQTKQGTTTNFHNGCDYGTNGEKWAQYALEKGNIISCGIASDGAKYIWVNYPRINKKLLHYHLDSICVKSGQSVYEGWLLGYTGATGMATGIHLHLGMQESNRNVYQDPDEYNYTPVESGENSVRHQYIVQDGDNLTKIAEKYNTTWQEIYEENKEVIGNNPDIIKPGQILKIINNKIAFAKYIVQDGDNLTKIAEKYNTTWQNLYEKNKNVIGNNPDIIRPGQIIEI